MCWKDSFMDNIINVFKMVYVVMRFLYVILKKLKETQCNGVCDCNCTNKIKIHYFVLNWLTTLSQIAYKNKKKTYRKLHYYIKIYLFKNSPGFFWGATSNGTATHLWTKALLLAAVSIVWMFALIITVFSGKASRTNRI